MQRMKGQGNPVPNGPKDQNFSSFQNYSNPMTSSIPGPSDPYMSSFYMTSSPYQAFGVGDGSWSNGSEHMQTFLGGYGGQVGYDSHSTIDGIFSGGNFGGFNAAGFNYSYHGNSDYTAWGSDVRNNAKYDDYYQRSVYPDDNVKAIEQGVEGIDLSDSKIATDGSKDQLERNASNNSEKITNESSNNSDHVGITVLSQPKKGLSWASVASQPAKPQPSRRRDKTTLTSIAPGRHMDIGTWEGKNGGPKPVAPPPAPRPAWDAPRGISRSSSSSYATPPPQPIIETSTVASSQLHVQPSVNAANTSMQHQPSYQYTIPASQSLPHQISQQQFHQNQQTVPSQQSPQQAVSITQSQLAAGNSTRPDISGSPQPVENTTMLPQQSPSADDNNPTLDDLNLRNVYNPKECEMCIDNARFFVIKSYSEDDIHRSIKYEIWCSTEHGNKRLDGAFRERENKGPIFLFFSVNGSGHFCGIAQMISNVDYSSSSSVWAQDKWKGKFRVKWVYVKDVPNSQLRHIRLENNENKPVTNSRDTQEVPFDDGKQVIKIIHGYRHKTSIFDDFIHYEKRQEETEYRRGHNEVDRDVRRGDQRLDHRGGDQRIDHRDQRMDHRGDQRMDHRGDQRMDHRGDQRVDHRGDQRVDQRGDQRVDQRVDHRGDQRVDHRGDQRVDHRGDQRVDHRGDQRMDHRGGDQRLDYNDPRDHRGSDRDYNRDYHRGASMGGGRSRGHYHHHRGGSRQ